MRYWDKDLKIDSTVEATTDTQTNVTSVASETPNIPIQISENKRD